MAEPDRAAWVYLLPFSATLGSYPTLRTAVVFYGLNLLLIGQSLFWLWRYAHCRGLIRAKADPAFLKLVSQRMPLADSSKRRRCLEGMTGSEHANRGDDSLS
jgi:hypothetical protein